MLACLLACWVYQTWLVLTNSSFFENFDKCLCDTVGESDSSKFSKCLCDVVGVATQTGDGKFSKCLCDVVGIGEFS